MSNVRMPIKTTKNGEKIAKICVEDVYKIINRIYESIDKSYNESTSILDSVHKQYGDYEGELIVGTGISEPCPPDKFDEKIGNDIAFMKAKLNANIKKHNLLTKVWNSYEKVLYDIDTELIKIDSYIKMDLDNLRKYNPSYLEDLEYDLGII